MQEIGKFDQKGNAISNGMEKYKRGNLAFIDSLKFMNSSLKKCSSKLTKNKFEYLSQEFSKKQLELVK